MHKVTEIIKEGVWKGEVPEMVNPPVNNGSTVLFSSYEELALAQKGAFPGFTYGTDRLPPQRAFEEALGRLQGAHTVRAFPSGISAIINALMAFTKSGDHILMCENVYAPTRRFCHRILSRYNIQVSYYRGDGEGVEDLIRDNTTVLYLESPGSNTMELQDLPAMAALAKKRGLVSIIDNTWGTPLYLRPFDLGIDVSIQSVTKYIAGHSDIIMGTISVNERLSEELDLYYHSMELYASPQDCYLALRGLKTLAVRLKHHEQAALDVAKWLGTRDEVKDIFHPALKEHPQHEYWKKCFTGSAGLFSFTFNKEYSQEQLGAFIDSLKLFGIGYSWGGFKSLISAGRYKRMEPSLCNGVMVIRLNIGLEDTEDLIEDLKSGFQFLAE